MNVAMLLRGFRRAGDRALLDAGLLCLTRMAEGGVYDQLGGGFHRYSVDEKWAVPRFEKMLYDNAQLVHLYSEAMQLEPRPLWRKVVEETVAYLAREMTSADGAFFAAQDADTEGEEGKTCVWNPGEIGAVVGKAGLTVMEPQQDRGNQAEAARVAAALIQAHPDLVGMAGFDSESGPGLGQAIKEAGLAGRIAATCVDAEEQHLRLVKEGVLSAAIGQKRELFTYQGVKTLVEIVHSPLKFTSDDRKAGIVPVPVAYNTGTYTVTRDNVDLFLGPKSGS